MLELINRGLLASYLIDEHEYDETVALEANNRAMTILTKNRESAEEVMSLVKTFIKPETKDKFSAEAFRRWCMNYYANETSHELSISHSNGTQISFTFIKTTRDD